MQSASQVFMSLFNIIKQKVSILEVVNEYTSLKKMGLYYKGTCPFHHERTASFTVSPHKDIFYCFGCHIGGDVISFIAKLENCSQLEAARLLIERYQIIVPELAKDVKSEGSTEERKRYTTLCSLLAEWTHNQLLQYKEPLGYLLERKITLQSIKNFTLGYFPGGPNPLKQLLDYAKQHMLLAQDLLHARILLEGKSGLYSPFEERIIFPIKDHLGYTVGFGGRTFKLEDERAKYYNSHDHPFFNKGSLLFGLDKAKKSIQEKEAAFLVEGYIDTIMMVQQGYPNTIATLGTSCTQEHLKQLSRYTPRLYITYDNDTAGQKAIIRLLELCWQVNLDLYVISLPLKYDPASYLAEKGDLKPCVDEAQDIFLFFIKATNIDFHKKGLQEKLSITKRIIEIIGHIRDPLKQDLLLQQAATTFVIPFTTLKSQLSPSFIPEKDAEPLALNSLQKGLDKISQLEKNLFCAILYSKESLSSEDAQLLQAWLPEPIKSLFIKAISYNGYYTLELFSDEERPLVSKLIMEGEERGTEDVLENLLLQFYKKQWKIILNNVKLKIKRAQQEQDVEAVKKSLAGLEKLKKKMLSRGVHD